MRRSRQAIALATAGAVAFAAAPALAGPPSAAKPRRSVEVADDFFGPAKFTVKPGTRIVWRWSDRSAGVHDVKLVKGPRGVRRFHSEPGSAGFRYSRVLTRPGSYKLICTFHIAIGMQMRIIVRR